MSTNTMSPEEQEMLERRLEMYGAVAAQSRCESAAGPLSRSTATEKPMTSSSTHEEHGFRCLCDQCLSRYQIGFTLLLRLAADPEAELALKTAVALVRGEIPRDLLPEITETLLRMNGEDWVRKNFNSKDEDLRHLRSYPPRTFGVVVGGLLCREGEFNTVLVPALRAAAPTRADRQHRQRGGREPARTRQIFLMNESRYLFDYEMDLGEWSQLDTRQGCAGVSAWIGRLSRARP